MHGYIGELTATYKQNPTANIEERFELFLDQLRPKMEESWRKLAYGAFLRADIFWGARIPYMLDPKKEKKPFPYAVISMKRYPALYEAFASILYGDDWARSTLTEAYYAPLIKVEIAERLESLLATLPLVELRKFCTSGDTYPAEIEPVAEIFRKTFGKFRNDGRVEGSTGVGCCADF